MITEPTRVTAHWESLLDVILTNNPDIFKKCGAYQPEMSDHQMMEKVNKHKTRTNTFWQTRSTDFEHLLINTVAIWPVTGLGFQNTKWRLRIVKRS